MKLSFFRASILVLCSITAAGCGSSRRTAETDSVPAPLEYVVDLNDRSDDAFKVTLYVDDLDASNAVYQFAATAPGTYQVMDIGRYVRAFEARDASGRAIPSERVGMNQWRISDPEAVTEIRYAVLDTWDAPVDEHPIYRMAGTSLEDDHALLSNQAVFGYPTGMQTRPIRVRLDRPADWTVGTALETDAAGYYLAADYDFLVDSPILAGTLTHSDVDVRGTDVDVYTYSVTGAVTSAEILSSVQSILDAAGTYLGELPVDHYAFLFHFEDVTMGALEHSYSSTYALGEDQFDALIGESIPDIVAHEFLHIVTPLNIHSEVIEHFNFVEPTPSEHVWLYEGATEWMSHAAQLRAGLIDLDDYLERLTEKLQNNDNFDTEFSLSDIGLESFTAKGQQEWSNIYQRGSIFSTLLNIKLLSLSGGTRGLREVILDLSKTYGPKRAFDEASFFDTFTAMTYPEIRPLFDAYVRGTQPLPLEETFDLVGIDYVPEVHTGEQRLAFGVAWGASGNRIVFAQTSGPAAACGFETGDLILQVEGADVTLSNAQEMVGRIQALEADEPFTITVERDGAARSITCAKKMEEQIERHVLRIDPDATPEQVALREAWASRL